MGRVGIKQRRAHEVRFANGLIYVQCRGFTHPEGAWVPLEDWQQARRNGHGNRVLVNECRRCRTTRQRHHRGNDQTVSLDTMEVYLKQIILLSGGIRAAAENLGVSNVCLRRWLRKAKHVDHSGSYYIKNMQKKSALRVLLTLDRLQRERKQAA